MKNIKINRKTAFGIASVLVAGALLALIDGQGNGLVGWVAYSLLLGLSVLVIALTARAVQADPEARKIAWVAFGVRLAAGMLLTLLLPTAGFPDQPATLQGYVFEDASFRDHNSWALAQSTDSLFQAFSGKYPGDQYGGLMFLSALIYRYMSPDAHRQMLVLLLNAAAAAAGTLFIWGAAKTWFKDPIPKASAWIFALYPESILLGASQMRESFALMAIAMAFFGVTRAREGGWSWLAWLLGAGAVLLPIQPAGGLAALLVLSGLWFFDKQHKITLKQGLIFAGILLVAAVVVISVLARLPSLQGISSGEVILQWLTNNFNLQAQGTIKASGPVQAYLRSVLPLVIYGMTRPVLPGALIDPTRPIWWVINSLRAAGWYLLAPFLLYGFWRALKAPDRRAQLIWLAVWSALWVVIASVNGGADEWDNPRYRTLFLVWQAVLAAWAWWHARERHDAWLTRWLMVEGVFVLLFVEWYISRNYPGYFIHLSFPIMVSLCLAAAALILGGGWLHDWRKSKRLADLGLRQ